MKPDVHLFLIWESAQIPLLEERIASGEPMSIVVLDVDVELDLKQKGISFLSLADLSQSPSGDREVLEWTRKLALDWYTNRETAFFTYDGILLGQQYEVVVLYYLQTVVYYVAVLDQVFSHFSNLRKVTIPETFVQVPPTADPTGYFKEHAPSEVARLLAVQRGIEFEMIPAPLSQKAGGRMRAFKRELMELATKIAVGTSNFFITHLSRRRPIVLFATDPWVRLEPMLKNMPDVELVMSRRQEMRAMGILNIWWSRVRFHHRLDFVGRSERTRARQHAADMRQQWDALGSEPEFSKQYVYKGISFWPIAKQVFDAIVRDNAEDAIATIENTKARFKHHGVTSVLLFASTKGYNNLVAHVSENLNIPSVENQHALVNAEKTLVHCRLHSRYLASYGPIINHIYESFGVEPWRLVECGSPRFDAYATPVPETTLTETRKRLKLDGGYVNALFGIQQIFMSLEYGNFNSYEVRQILEDVADIHRNTPNLRMLMRPRPDRTRERFYNREETRDLFQSETRWVGQESMHELLAVSDFVVTGTSTVVLEALLMHKPVVLYVPKLLDSDFKLFWEAGGILMARTKEELAAHVQYLTKSPEHRAAQTKRGDEFVKNSFDFDGHSAERLATFIRRTSRPVIEGTKVVLEPLAPTHVSQEYARWFSDSDTTRYNRHGSGMSLSDLEKYVGEVSKSDQDAVFAVIAKDRRVHIGNISLQKINWQEKSAEYAILMGNERYRKGGFAKEASQLLLGWGFGQLGLDTIRCGTPVQHTDMRGLATRLGFIEQGVRKNAMVKDGESWDVVEYEMHKGDLRI